jgi:thymidine kinase
MSPIEVETGPMFSGKTTELLDQANNLIVAGEVQGVDFLVFNHASDTRYGENVIGSHGHISLEAIPAKSSKDIFDNLFDIDDKNNITLKTGKDLLSTLFIDEGQFFDMNLSKVIEFIDRYYRENLGLRINIYCAGLDMDFRGEPFGPMPDIMAIANKVNKFFAVCKECDKRTPRNAQYTQRLINGEPANYDDPIILVAAAESYTARCQKHHQVPNKPTPKFEK